MLQRLSEEGGCSMPVAQEILTKLDELKLFMQVPQGYARALEAVANLEQTLGISGVLDFHFAEPSIFEVPQANSGQGVQYTKEHWERKLRVPAFKRELQCFITSATESTAFILAPVRWPDRFGGFLVSGFKPGCYLMPAVANQFYSWSRKLDGDFVADAILLIRGAFEYGQFGVFLLAMNYSKLKELFGNKKDLNLQDPYRVIPPEFIVDLVGEPTTIEKELIDEVTRAYWNKIRTLGGCNARMEYNSKPMSYNPDYDPIPYSLLRNSGLPPHELELGNRLGFRGVLETCHRFAKINKLIEGYKAKHPSFTAP